MWVIKDYEMVNLDNVDSIEISVCKSDNQFELLFYKDVEKINTFCYESEEELKRNYEIIINGIRNNVKVLNI